MERSQERYYSSFAYEDDEVQRHGLAQTHSHEWQQQGGK